MNSLDTMPRTRAWLTEQGASFSSFFVTQALCCPSRASILTGRYVHNHGVVTTTPPDGGFVKFHGAGLESQTIAVALERAGYRTALFGKYFNGYPRGEALTFVPQGWNEWEVPTSVIAAYSELNYTLNVNGKLVAHAALPEDYFTDVLSRAAADFVTRQAAAAQPFFLYLAPVAPHRPFIPAARHAEAFKGLRVPRTPSFNEEDVSDKPLFLQRPPLRPFEIRELDRIYRARAQSMLAIDEMVEALFGALKSAGVLDNTFVFFASDNGVHLGQHRLDARKNTAYEEDVHVPLLVRGPGVPAGRVIPELAANIDLAPTFAELAGVALPGAIDGRSLVSLWSGRDAGAVSTPWRQAILLEHPDPPSRAAKAAARAAQLRDSEEEGLPSPPFMGLRMATESYVEYGDGSCEDYDLAKDPQQLDNRCAHLAPPARKERSAWLRVLATCQGATCRTLENRPPS